MVVRSFFRVIISLVGAALPLLFLSGSYSPLGSSLGKKQADIQGSRNPLVESVEHYQTLNRPEDKQIRSRAVISMMRLGNSSAPKSIAPKDDHHGSWPVRFGTTAMMHNIQAAMPGESKGLLLLALILSLAFPIASLNHYPQHPAVGFPLGFPRSGQSRPLASLASAAPYDEQVGVTFTQDFSKLAFNVTAVAFSDPDGVGPGYLVNGLTDYGYWYQVGLSYNWPYTLGGFNPGFRMNFEVFDNTGVSFDPSSGGGGLKPFNGPVNPGDTATQSQLRIGVCGNAGYGLADGGSLITLIPREWQHLCRSPVQPKLPAWILHRTDDRTVP